jgi:hypothetical protein
MDRCDALESRPKHAADSGRIQNCNSAGDLEVSGTVGASSIAPDGQVGVEPSVPSESSGFRVQHDAPSQIR